MSTSNRSDQLSNIKIIPEHPIIELVMGEIRDVEDDIKALGIIYGLERALTREKLRRANMFMDEIISEPSDTEANK